jgi:hypothetical protein
MVSCAYELSHQSGLWNISLNKVSGIGINWGMTVCGCFAALLIPMPFIFYSFGKNIRAKSMFAPGLDQEQDDRRREEAPGGSVSQTNEESPEAPIVGSGSEDKNMGEKRNVLS